MVIICSGFQTSNYWYFSLCSFSKQRTWKANTYGVPTFKLREWCLAFWNSVLALDCPNWSLSPGSFSSPSWKVLLLCIITRGGLLSQPLPNQLSPSVSPPVWTLNRIWSLPRTQEFQNFIYFSFIQPSHTLYFIIFFVPGIVFGARNRHRAQRRRQRSYSQPAPAAAIERWKGLALLQSRKERGRSRKEKRSKISS